MDYLDTRPWAHRTSAFPAAFAEWVDARLPAFCRSSLVDWGAGTGDFMRAFLDRGFSVSGFDRDLRAPGVREADFGAHLRGVPCGVTDVALCRNVLEHLPDPSHLLSAIRHNLHDDGVAVIAVPDWRTYAPIFYSDYTHVRPYDRVSLPDLLRVSGFEVLEVHEIVQHAACLRSRALRALSEVVRVLVPLMACRAVSRWTGVEFFEWAALRTLVVFCKKGVML